MKVIIFNILVITLFLLFYLFTRRYESEFVHNIDSKQHKLKIFYPMGLYLLDHSKLKEILVKSEKVEDSLKAIYPGEQIYIVKRLYYCNKITIILMILIFADIFALSYNVKSDSRNQLLEGNYILRPEYEEEPKIVDLEVQVTEGESILLEEEIQLEVKQRLYDNKKIEELFNDAKKHIDSTYLLNNSSSEEVLTDLKFVEGLPNSNISIVWDTGDYEIIDLQGKVHNEKITESILVWITATISYGEKEEDYTRYVRVLPKVYNKEEKTRLELLEVIELSMNHTLIDDKVTLPKEFNNHQVFWKEKTDRTGILIILFAGLLALLFYLTIDKDLYDKVELRNREMLLDYPEIINKLTLFVGAGMSISNAWKKIARDYKEKGNKKRYAYEEVVITYNELMVGTPEISAYERFGRRVKLLPYLRFSSLTAQNVKKGNNDFLKQLEFEAAEAFEERKELAKRMGEEAGTKLLVPMMLMLVIVLSIIMVPAFLSFNV